MFGYQYLRTAIHTVKTVGFLVRRGYNIILCLYFIALVRIYNKCPAACFQASAKICRSMLVYNNITRVIYYIIFASSHILFRLVFYFPVFLHHFYLFFSKSCFSRSSYIISLAHYARFCLVFAPFSRFNLIRVYFIG